MFMTVVEGHVAEDKWAGLAAAYQAGSKNMPPPMLEVFLAQDVNDRTLWRALTVWKSREALIEYRQSGAPGAGSHRGEALFKEAGAEPVAYFLDVAVHAAAETA